MPRSKKTGRSLNIDEVVKNLINKGHFQSKIREKIPRKNPQKMAAPLEA